MSFDLKLINGDLAISKDDIAIVENGDKLVQDILKIISTPTGGNAFFPNYGTDVSNLIVGSTYDKKFVSDIASEQLTRSLEFLQKLQEEQIKYNQRVTPHEQIAAILDVSVSRAADDPRYYSVNLTVLSKAFVRHVASFSISTV